MFDRAEQRVSRLPGRPTLHAQWIQSQWAVNPAPPMVMAVIA